LVTITFSFVLGLGVAQILSAASSAVRERDDHPLHWKPFLFAFCIFVLHVQFWFALFLLDTRIPSWSWGFYAPLLLLAVILFMGGGIVLPPAGSHAGESLRDDFEQRGRASILFLIAYVLGWIPLNIWLDGTWQSAGLFFNLVVAADLAVAYWARSARTRNLASMALAALVAYGVLFVWSTPDVLG
jgi:hypothetical protein